MGRRILQLYQLQTLDSEIDQIDQQLAAIAAQLGQSDALKAARAKLDAAETRLRQGQTIMQDLDLELKSLVNKVTQQEKLLYSGKVLSAKEAANLQDEVASLKRRQSTLEERLLEAMVEVEDAENALADAQQTLNAVEAAWLDDQVKLEQEQAELESRRADLQDHRPAMTEGVDQNDLDTYENLRRKKAGRAIASVKDGVCRACGMTPSHSKLKQARSGDIVYCSVCGRILYAS